MAQGVTGRLRPRIFSTFGTRRVIVRQPNSPAVFIRGEISGTRFQRLSRPQGTWFCLKEPRKKSPVTPPGIDPGTVRLAAQCLNHYATYKMIYIAVILLCPDISISLSSCEVCPGTQVIFLLDRLNLLAPEFGI